MGHFFFIARIYIIATKYYTDILSTYFSGAHAMAKKVQSLSNKDTSTQDVRQIYSGSFVGDFTGDLTGNAETATSLAAPFTVTLTGNAQGNFSTAGGNAMLDVRVLQADNARFAEVAQTAQRVDSAGTAQYATAAGSATYATNAGHATGADVATHAETATNSDHAITADSAGYAPHADEAEHAHTADSAKTATEAEHAKTADVAAALANPDTPVKEAEHAETATLATMAQYDCQGKSFIEYYALKSEIPTDYLTEKQANNLYVPRREQVTQAVVKGKAFGHGFLCGNTLMIMIDDLACDDTGLNIYGDLEFVDQFVEELANTTKVYVDSRGRMFVYAAVVDDFGAPGLGHWVEITSGIADDVQQALDKLENVVTITGPQTITGRKEFTAIVKAGIPSEDTDDPHSVVTLHNLKDLRDDIDNMLASIEKGGFAYAYKDYTLVENQAEMKAGVTYIGYRAGDKSYIAISPETGKPIDSGAKVEYLRYFRKDSRGQVGYFDIKAGTLDEYAKLSGADFTGPITVPYLNLEVSDKRVFNSADVKHLIADAVDGIDGKYMPLAGGTFSGEIFGPYAQSIEDAKDNQYLVKSDVEKLITTQALSIEVLDSKPASIENLTPLKLYAYPAAIDPNAVTKVSIYDHPVTIDDIDNGEAAFYGVENLLD